jgi:hypothetical protein
MRLRNAFQLRCHAFADGLPHHRESPRLVYASADVRETQKVLGWYHSRTRSRIFLSEPDLQIHSRYFAPTTKCFGRSSRVGSPCSRWFLLSRNFGRMRTESSYEEFYH